MKYNSSLSIKRILISLLILALMPFERLFVEQITGNETIAYTFALNITSWALIIYDWNLFAIHWNRFKSRLGDGFLYTIVGICLLTGWLYINQAFLKGVILTADRQTASYYDFAIPAIIFAFSFSQGTILNISFKCLTDHLDIRSREVLLILLSGLLFGLVYTVLIVPFQIDLFVRSYLFYVILIIILSYLYNQSSSFIPGILSFTTVFLIYQIFEII